MLLHILDSCLNFCDVAEKPQTFPFHFIFMFSLSVSTLLRVHSSLYAYGRAIILACTRVHSSLRAQVRATIFA